MATVNKIFKPRRGKKSTMAGTKASTVLAAGELFLETPDTGVGKGASKIKIGDGTTKYSSLPYALGDTTNEVITYSSNTSTTVATALNNVASGKKLGLMIAGLKQAVSLLNTSVTSLNDDISNIEQSFQDGCKTIADKITALGVTTSATASPTTIANNINTLATNKYNSGYNASSYSLKISKAFYYEGSNATRTYSGSYTATKTGNLLFVGTVSIPNRSSWSVNVKNNNSNITPITKGEARSHITVCIIKVNQNDVITFTFTGASSNNNGSALSAVHFVYNIFE